jgi:1,2-diacylglycerol 3-beta-galactosyltransferase
MVTVLTDIADYPPHFWIEDQDQWVICGSDRAVNQAIEIGIRPERVRKASGMILRPHFYEPIQVDRRAERQRLGLDPDRPAGLVLFGGYGAGVMFDIAERLQSAESGPQLICLCGRNQGLADRIRNLDNRYPIHVEGFTKEIPYFMSLADFFIGKPGPGSISEAIHMNLPVIVRRNARTLPQERYNADWITENKLGLVIPSFREVGGAVRELLEPDRFREFHAAAAAIENRAVFEIPDILGEILESSG